MNPTSVAAWAALVTAIAGGVGTVLAYARSRQADVAKGSADSALAGVQTLKDALNEQRQVVAFYRQGLADMSVELHDLTDKVAGLAEKHADCERRYTEQASRLHLAEARIAELGG